MNDTSPRVAGFRRRFGLGVLALAAAVVTIAWPDWIEEVFHVDPDGGSGTLEVSVVVALALVSIASFAASWTVRRRVRDS
jgi:hypothetical protein